ncbi:MAG: 50S ribosomal protein L30 [Infirmifilum sp.]
MPLLAVVRIRGTPDRSPEERKTLELLRLHKVNHCVLLPDTPSIRGMLKRAEYVVTYGEIDKETLVEVLRKRGRLIGNRPLTDDYVKSTGFDSIEGLAEALLEGKVSLSELPGLKPVFRLHPPKGGFRGSVKKHVNEGGELGYRGSAINALLKRMI